MTHKLTVEEMNRLNITDFKAAPKLPLTLVLDDVRSMYNVGSMFRTADAFRLAELCLCGITGCPPHREIHKTALGAEDSVAWRYFPTAVDAVACLKAEGKRVWAVEQVKGSCSLDTLTLDPSQHYALVLGNEVKGVSQTAVDACEAALEVPQFGTKHSLNVAVTAGVVMWEFLKQLAPHAGLQ